jgi:hypothetical protein
MDPSSLDETFPIASGWFDPCPEHRGDDGAPCPTCGWLDADHAGPAPVLVLGMAPPVSRVLRRAS